MTIISTLVEKFPVRRSKEQKEAFRAWAVEQAQAMGYQAQVESLKDHHNVVIGSPETAQVIFTAHYDTPAGFFLPNLMTPRNKLVFWLRQFWMILIFILLGAVVGVPAGLLTGSREIGFWLGWLVYMGALMLMLYGPANKINVNDNTSGVAAILETMARIPEENRSKTAFILFDNEEKGMLGSGAYASSHKAVKKEKLLINMDCVGDGENILFFANKKTRALDVFPHLEGAMQGVTGRNFIMNKLEKCVYPSDQSQFKHGIAVCACNKMKVIGYYCDKIHTKKDTVCEQANLDFLAEGLNAFVAKL